MDLAELAFAGAAEQARLWPQAPSPRRRCSTSIWNASRAWIPVHSYRTVLTQTARQEAAAAQHRIDAGERLPLLGVPVAIKDDADVDGELTASAAARYRPPPSATLRWSPACAPQVR